MSQVCRIETCRQHYPEGGDGFDGYCPDCADWLEARGFWDAPGTEQERLLDALTKERE